MPRSILTFLRISDFCSRSLLIQVPFPLPSRSVDRLSFWASGHQGINAPGEVHIQSREAPGVVGGEGDAHPVPDIAPFRVMAQLLGCQGHPAHEAEGLGEVAETELPLKPDPVAAPVGKFRGQIRDLPLGQRLSGHHASSRESQRRQPIPLGNIPGEGSILRPVWPGEWRRGSV